MLLLLVIATALTWMAGHGEGAISYRLANTLILTVAWYKARIIMRDFMELRSSPAVLRIGGEIWLAALTISLITLSGWSN